jgi:hypothetical protein
VVLVAGSGFETDAAGVITAGTMASDVSASEGSEDKRQDGKLHFDRRISVLLKYVLGFAAEGESTKS